MSARDETWVERWLLPAGVLVSALALWEGAVAVFDLPTYLVPSPAAVLTASIHDAAVLAQATRTTAAESLVGFVTSALAGVTFAFVLTRARWIERSFVPYAVFLQTVPIVAVAPMLVLWFGIGFKAVAASSFIVAVFPVITAATAGLRSVDPEHRALFRLYGASRWQTFRELEAPSSVPYLAAGLRSSSGLSVIGAVVGEFVAGHSEGHAGLGTVILGCFRQMQTPLMFGAILCCSALGLALYAIVSASGARWLARWHASAQA